MCLGNLFGSSRPTPPPPPPPPPPIPTVTRQEERQTAQRAAGNARRQALARTGRSQTILTSPLGVTGQAAINRPTLLGQTA